MVTAGQPVSDPAVQEAPIQDASGFFRALFDFSFSSFITTRIIKVLYIISIVLIGLGSVAFLIAGLTQGAGAAIVALIGAPLFFILYVIITRMWLELIIVIFRIAEYTREISRQGRS